MVRWMGLGEKRPFDQVEFERDVLRVTLLYRKSGYLSVVVDTLVKRTPKDISITFLITEGLPVRLDSLTILGLDSVTKPGAVTQDLPLRPGDPFNRILLDATSDTLVRRLGTAAADAIAFQSFERDKTELAASAAIELQTGPLADVSGIGISGTKRISPDVVRSLLATRPGQQFSQEDLYRSQRNLYRSELFNFAAWHDSAAYDPASDSVPLTVRVTESKRGGRAAASGTPRRTASDLAPGSPSGTLRERADLDVSGRLSNQRRLPTDWGDGGGVPLLAGGAGPRLGKVNYRLAVSLRRPASRPTTPSAPPSLPTGAPTTSCTCGRKSAPG
jgi:hypothetical protein